jgi:hypothetical protein
MTRREQLVHRSAGKPSNRIKDKKFKVKVVRLSREKYSGEVGERFGPTLVSEHLGSQDKIELSVSTARRWMLEQRGRGGCLMVDDATSTILCRLGQQETIWAAVGMLKAWIEKYEFRERRTRIGRTFMCGNPPRRNCCREPLR